MVFKFNTLKFNDVAAPRQWYKIYTATPTTKRRAFYTNIRNRILQS